MSEPSVNAVLVAKDRLEQALAILEAGGADAAFLRETVEEAIELAEEMLARRRKAGGRNIIDFAHRRQQMIGRR